MFQLENAGEHTGQLVGSGAYYVRLPMLVVTTYCKLTPLKVCCSRLNDDCKGKIFTRHYGCFFFSWNMREVKSTGQLVGSGAHHVRLSLLHFTAYSKLTPLKMCYGKMNDGCMGKISPLDTVCFFSWKTREVKSTGRLSIDSNGHKNLKISAGLGGSSFDSRGGVVGGAIDLQDLSIFCEYTSPVVNTPVPL